MLPSSLSKLFMAVRSPNVVHQHWGDKETPKCPNHFDWDCIVVLSDEQRRHYCAIVAPVGNIFVQCKALFSKWLSRRRRCNRDKIRVKQVKDWNSTFEDAESWRGVSGVRCKLQTLDSPQATNGWQFSTGEEGGWVFVTQLISQRCPSTLR